MSDERDLDLYFRLLDSKISVLESEKEAVAKQLFALRESNQEQEILTAIAENDWKRLLKTSDKGLTVKVQDDFWNKHLLPVNKIVERAGYYPETNQISFKLKLIDYRYNQDQIGKLLPVLYPIIENLTPIEVQKDVPNRYRAFLIFDTHQGTEGTKSLIINTNGECGIYCRNRTKPQLLDQFTDLQTALIKVAKNHYFFTK